MNVGGNAEKTFYMQELPELHQYSITMFEGKIHQLLDEPSGLILKGFKASITQNKKFKLYVIKENDEFLYVGTTSQSLTTRFRSGLAANGQNGYHGYKWKTKESLKLFVLCFPNLNKMQMENIEAELVFIIRREQGVWPLTQNEIHFNNDFVLGKEIADRIFRLLS